MGQTIEKAVGKRIRAIRKRRGWSLRELSGVCGLSANAISRIERGENSPTISSLSCLAKALEVSLTEFLPGEETSCLFVSCGEGTRLQSREMVLESLGLGFPGQAFEPFRMEVESGTNPIPNPLSHPGQEFVYCLQGELDFRVGEKEYQLQPGDSLLFDASQPHAWHNPYQQTASVLLILHSDRNCRAARESHLAL